MHLSADSNVLVDAYTCHSQYFDTDASPVRGHSCHGSHGHQHGRRSHSPHRVRQHQQRAEHKHTALEHATDGSLLTLANAGQPSPVVDVST
uniref:Uncharacterized protein n=1 Tax=Chlamydomonas euryale TaxID=1486919 RepID=A0A7R9VD20_9CHLO